MHRSVKVMNSGNWRKLYRANGASDGASYNFP